MIKLAPPLLAAALVLVGWSGCSHRPDLPSFPQYQPLGQALNHLQWYADSYGFGTVSAPLLVQPDDSFKFNLTRESADSFFAAARNEVNARSSGSSQHLRSAGLGLGLGAPIDLAMTPPLAAAPAAAAAPGLPVSAETRGALLLAAGDTATYAILSLLGDPEKMGRFSGKKVLFGVSMVSLNPGRLTRRDFAADVMTRAEYHVVPARPVTREAFLALRSSHAIESAVLRELQACVTRSLQSAAPPAPSATACAAPPPPFDQDRFAPYVKHCGDDGSPLVAAVSPMADAQMLDLQSALRRQRDLALQLDLALRSAGAQAAADGFLKWTQQQQQDAETRSANVVVNAYSAGGNFGFQIGPRLVADPRGRRDQVSGFTLDRQAFPTLILFGYDEDDLRPRVQVQADPQGGPPRCQVTERMMHLQTHTRWLPLTRHADAPSEDEWLRVVAEASQLRDLQVPVDLQPVLQRRKFLLSQVTGRAADIFLPVELMQPAAARATATPTAEHIAPAVVVLDRDDHGAVQAQDVQVLVAGDGLERIDSKKITIAMGKARWPGPVPNVKLVGKSLLLTVRIESAEEPLVFALPLRESRQSIRTPPLLVRVAEDALIEHRKAAGGETYRFPRGLAEGVLKSLLERERPAPAEKAKAEVKIDVKAAR